MKRDGEKRKTQNNYTGSFHNPEVVMPPCTSKESSLKSISDYNCSSKKARDFKLLKKERGFLCSSTHTRDFICSSTKARDF